MTLHNKPRYEADVKMYIDQSYRIHANANYKESSESSLNTMKITLKRLNWSGYVDKSDYISHIDFSTNNKERTTMAATLYTEVIINVVDLDLLYIKYTLAHLVKLLGKVTALKISLILLNEKQEYPPDIHEYIHELIKKTFKCKLICVN